MFRKSNSDHEPKFHGKLLSKNDILTTAPSFRIYYGGVSGSVPFLWESEPGTPKHSATSLPLPPLTPPPSYYYQNSTGSKKHGFTRYNLLRNLWSKISFVKEHKSSPVVDYSSSISSSSSSAGSYASAPTTPSSFIKGRRRNWVSFDHQHQHNHHDVLSKDGEININGWSKNQTCFGFAKSGNNNAYAVVVPEKSG
ncbi:uncharacterized protein LOC124940628 [Impatiens glandulifera]|uniref:uncharacterized protein LOC124940628 n=1 Tax=Impatiens glandulifera TaxID=253017 RepID=UPI001FB09360|nr:uncharacterized protein LOC124940628 [Impatiens glandulifera]